MIFSTDPRVRIELAASEDPIGDLFEVVTLGENSPFIRREMDADAVEFYNRWHFPWYVEPNEEFQKWADDMGIKYEMVERKHIIHIDNGFTKGSSNVFFTYVVFESERDKMLFKLTWA